ncbi:MAG: hypothetical protein H7Y04_12365 [Verrucomicrobia bacterium]|nr:hypothetical protein [Cytophagales bacterium]
MKLNIRFKLVDNLCKYLFLSLLPLFFANVYAQMPADGLMMSKGNLCNMLSYTNSSWESYWEGDTKRTNLNLGTVTTQNVMLMSAYGITDKLNVMLALPYIWTKSDSYFSGQKGFQDVSLWLKYKALEKETSVGTFSLFATGGVSTPVSKYVADFLPFSIGLRSRTASARLVLDFTSNPGFYLTAQAGYTHRSNITIDRDSYLYKGELFNTNKVFVPNMVDATVRVGFYHPKFQTDVWLDRFTALDGDDIRYNDMPFPSNLMQATTVGWFGKYNIKNFAVIGNVSKVMVGKNVGESTNFTLGVSYIVQVAEKKNNKESLQPEK